MLNFFLEKRKTNLILRKLHGATATVFPFFCGLRGSTLDTPRLALSRCAASGSTTGVAVCWKLFNN